MIAHATTTTAAPDPAGALPSTALLAATVDRHGRITQF